MIQLASIARQSHSLSNCLDVDVQSDIHANEVQGPTIAELNHSAWPTETDDGT